MTLTIDRPLDPPPGGRNDFFADRVPVTAEVLMAAIGRGDRQAFAVFYDRFQSRVRATARAIVRDPQLADDVSQEVFFEIWRKAALFDANKGSVAAWVLQLAHSRSVDRVRTSESRRRHDDHFGRHQVIREIDTVGDSLFARMEHDEVCTALDGLSSLQQEAIRVCYYQGLTHVQASQFLDVPLGTVKTRIRDGLIQLRGCLTDALA